MSVSFSERARYGVYAAIAMAAFLGYFSLAPRPDRPVQDVARMVPRSGGLPALVLTAGDDPREAGRWMCSPLPRPLSQIQAAPAVSAAQPTGTAETVAARPSPLAGLEVVGFVRGQN